MGRVVAGATGDLLAQADYVSLHTALSPATERLMNAQTLAQMKRGARLVNTARGELVDEAALAEALKSGQLAGAALDVFAVEPPKDSPLLRMPNVIATPHVAGSTAEAQEEVGVQIAQQVRDYLADGTLRNAVNLPAISPEQYRRLRPYLELAERLASLVAQAAPFAVGRVRIACRGRASRTGHRTFCASAALAGVLNAVLDERVNLVNAPTRAAERGLAIEETTRPRERGIADVVEDRGGARVATARRSFPRRERCSTALRRGCCNSMASRWSPRWKATLLLLRNRDVPGVIGKFGTMLGRAGHEHRHVCAGTARGVLWAQRRWPSCGLMARSLKAFCRCCGPFPMCSKRR